MLSSPFAETVEFGLLHSQQATEGFVHILKWKVGFCISYNDAGFRRCFITDRGELCKYL